MPRKSESLSTEVRMGKKICFVSLDSYPLLARNNTEIVGGAEVQQVILAKELLKHGFKVTFVTYGDEQASTEYIDNIEVIKVGKRTPTLYLNLFPRAWYIWKAMGKADADIYFHEAGASGLVVAIFCCLRRKRFVHYIPSDSNVSKKDLLMNYKFYHRLGIKLNIKLADVVIAQNEFQRKMLKENFRRESLIIKNAFPLPRQKIPEKASPPIVLWVATIRNAKQPELFLKLAEAITEARFQMIGGLGDSMELYQRIKESAARIPNLEFLGFIPFREIAEYFRQASILVNTSGVEGFSNTFIQAWQQYMPVVSLHSDPDEIICKYKLGFHSKTFQQLTEDVRTLLNDKQLREEMGRNGRQYVEKEHDITKVVPRYLEVFNRLLKNTKARL